MVDTPKTELLTPMPTIGDPAVYGRKSRKKLGDAVRKAVSASLNEFPPVLVDHAMRINGFGADLTLERILSDDSTFDKLMHTLTEAQKITASITRCQIPKGFIIARKLESSASSAGNPKRQDLIYEDFHPFRPRQFESDPKNYIIEFEGFNKAVDEFFSSIESQKLESRLNEREENAKKKLNTARQDHEKRLGGLQQAQQSNIRKAEAIEANQHKVHEAIAAVNGLIAQGMDWAGIARLIEMEQVKLNPVAEMISLPLKLYENSVTLLLTEAAYDAVDDFEGNETDSNVSGNEEDGTPASTANTMDRRLAVDIDLALSPWSNARQYYNQKKTAAVKEQKTIQSSAKALKSTERKINADLKKGLKQEKEVMRPVRKPFWFEKFVYFISSEGYLVLGGRDAQQNEILYKRHLKKGDVYVHADLKGAASVIIKNKPWMTESPVPPSTLSQAGTLAVATSSAWDSKAVMSAWWVKADQISKTAPTGDYLATGNFTITGQKHYLPPAQLLLGFGIMFQISGESKAKHKKHRIVEERPSALVVAEDSAVVESAVYRSENGKQALQESTRAGVSEITEDEPSQRSKHKGGPGSQDESSSHDANGNGSASFSNSEGDSDEDVRDLDGSKSDASAPERSGIQSLPTGRNPLQPASGENDEASQNSSSESTDDLSSNDEIPTTYPTRANHDDIPVEETSPPPAAGVRHFPARDRRLLRQDRHLEHDGDVDSHDVGDQEDPIPLSGSKNIEPSSNVPRSKTNEAAKPGTNSQFLPIRRKHGKRNKIKAKYADQDEEDRALALQVLGSAAGQRKLADDAEAKAFKAKELAAQKERRRKQHALAVEKGREAEEMRKRHMQDGMETNNDEEIETPCDLEAFVGALLPGDEVLDALVVCGPWDAIGSRCKWKAKLQPGTTKKGKVVREILGSWTTIVAGEGKRTHVPGEIGEGAAAEGKFRSKEGELIKGLRETELVGIVPVGRCRVVLGGGDGSGKSRGSGGGAKGKRGGKGSKKQR